MVSWVLGSRLWVRVSGSGCLLGIKTLAKEGVAAGLAEEEIELCWRPDKASD